MCLYVPWNGGEEWDRWGGDCTYCKNRIGFNSCINNIVKLKLTIATFVLLTGEETSEKALRNTFFVCFFLLNKGLGQKSMALLNCLPMGAVE